MIKAISIIVMLMSAMSWAKTVRVAVIDTGIGSVKPVLCENGLIDLTGEGIFDVSGHGTNISGIIEERNKDSDYCQIIIKYYKKYDETGNFQRSVQAFVLAARLNVDFVNFSSLGMDANNREKLAVENLLNGGTTLVVPSGNYPINLDIACSVYPACYDKRIVVVGSSSDKYNHGYGSIVDFYENSSNVSGFGITLSGTSQATATATAKLVAKMASKRRKHGKIAVTRKNGMGNISEKNGNRTSY